MKLSEILHRKWSSSWDSTTKYNFPFNIIMRVITTCMRMYAHVHSVHIGITCFTCQTHLPQTQNAFSGGAKCRLSDRLMNRQGCSMRWPGHMRTAVSGHTVHISAA